MRTCFLLLFSFMFLNASAQNIRGNWIKISLTYADGTEVAEDYPLKYHYLKYSFNNPITAYTTNSFDTRGADFSYSVSNNHLKFFHPTTGYVTNEFMVEKAAGNELVLLQIGRDGFKGPDCIRYYFISEPAYVKDYQPSAKEILPGATGPVYIANEKLYPVFNGAGEPFDLLKDGTSDQSKDVTFLANYIVRKDGTADSFKVIRSINSAFDKKVTNNFMRINSNWLPATLNGEPVDTRMQVKFRYHSSGVFSAAVGSAMRADRAVSEGRWADAVKYYSAVLEKIPDDTETLYKRALCYFQQGKLEEGCADLKKIQSLGEKTADVLISKVCN